MINKRNKIIFFTEKSDLKYIDYTGYVQLPPTLTCKECNKCLTSRDAFEKHIATHVGYRPYVCTVCNLTYTLKSSLLQHVRKEHMGILPFACQFCGKKFADRRKRSIHERIHTGDKPYECKYCGRRFAQVNACKSHEIKHTGVKPFSCERCDYQCYTQSELTLHWKSKHEGKILKIENITSTMLKVTACSCHKKIRAF